MYTKAATILAVKSVCVLLKFNDFGLQAARVFHKHIVSGN